MTAPSLKTRRQSPFWPAACPDPEQVRLAGELTEALYPCDDDSVPSSPAFHALGRQCGELDPRAVASQYTFAVCHHDRYGLLAIVAPSLHWEREGYLPRRSAPVARLLPQGSHDDLYPMWWAIPGYDSLEQGLALTFELLRLGFFWDAAFQTNWDQNFDSVSPPVNLSPLIEGRELEPRSAAAAPARAALRV